VRVPREPPVEGYVNPTTISVAWELDEGEHTA
jgi:hypothetical protein